MKKHLPNSSNIENLKHIKKDGNFKLSDNVFEIPFYKKDFVDFKEYVRFIKQVEKIVRNSDHYKSYINYLKSEIGLSYCMVFPKIDSEKEEKITVEMHHGPILTLFDYCDILTSSYIKQQKKFNTITIAKQILKEHFKNHVQVIMLSKSVHQAIHSNSGLFIHPKQAWGNINKFLNKYNDGINEELRKKINNYILLSKNNKSSDNEVFEMKQIKDWNVKNNQQIKIEGDETNDLFNINEFIKSDN